jgi:DNA mismatch repair protein MutL
MPLLKVGGYAAKPIFSRGNRSCEVFFINGRYVKSPLLTKALENAYNGFMMQHRYPFAVLYLEIDPAMIDVNVHPAKREIRFRQEDMVYHRLYEAVRRSLEGLELIPDVGFGQDGLKRKKAVSERPAEKPPEPFEKARREAGNELSTIELLQRSFRQEMEKEKRKEYAEAVSDRQASSHQQDDGKPTAGSGTAADGQAAGAVSSGIRLADSVGSTADRPAADAATFEARPTEGFGSSADELTAGFLPAEDDATYGQGEASPGQAQHTEAASGKGEDSGVPDGADSFSGEGTLLRETAAEIYYKGLDDTGSGKNTQLSLDERLFTESSRKEFVLIGQLFGTYWLIQYRDKFMMIDQHAAHERLLYERLLREKQLETPDARKAYFADKPVARMTAQDSAVYEEILSFIEA